MLEAAGAEKAGTTCDRVFVTPETGSDLELGQIFLGCGFFFEDQVLASVLLEF